MFLKLGSTCLKTDVLIFVFSTFIILHSFPKSVQRRTYFHTLFAEISFCHFVTKYGEIIVPSRILCRDWLWKK